MIVVDTNMVVYLVIAGPHTPLAERVLERDSDWCVPVLWRSEFRNVLARRIRESTSPLSAAFAAANAAESLMADREFQPSGQHVLRLAADSGCTAYDCEFVAVARDLAVPLVTLDREITRRFPAVAIEPQAFLRKRSR